MTVEHALEFFAAVPTVARKLQTLMDVGTGYIRLGQSATTLSGGEAQRVKLALELSKRATPAARCTSWTNPPPACIFVTLICCCRCCTACASTATTLW